MLAFSSMHSACGNMQGQYQRAESKVASQEPGELTLYLKHIPGSHSGYYGMIYPNSKPNPLQPIVKENPACTAMFENMTLKYVGNDKHFDCDYIISANVDKTQFYCMKKVSNSISEKTSQDFDKTKLDPWYEDTTETDSVIQWCKKLHNSSNQDN
jgi:hypothetical protein